MGAYIIKRVFSLIPVLVLVGVTAFFLVHIIPGDPAVVMLGTDATPQQIQELQEQMGLNRPLYVQFVIWAGNVLRGDLGESYFLGRSVTTALMERLPATISLAIVSLFIAVLVGIPSGILAAIKQNRFMDQTIMVVAMIGVSVPSFWLGLTLILLFSVILRWFPSGGYIPLSEDFFGGLRYIILPALALGFMQTALIARMARSSMLEVLCQDYIRTARSKGLKEHLVIIRHALKNTMIPVLTVIGLVFGILLSGTIIVETVFTYPGVGRLVVKAVRNRDYPLIQGALLMVSGIYVLVNLLVDLLYPILDPRIKYN